MTLNGAKVLRVDHQLGSIAPGKLADLVVIRGNPIATPGEIRNVTVVFKDGVGYDSPKLLASVKGLVGIRSISPGVSGVDHRRCCQSKAGGVNVPVIALDLPASGEAIELRSLTFPLTASWPLPHTGCIHVPRRPHRAT